MREMANLDYKVLVSELQFLTGSRLQRLYELSPNIFRFHFYVSGKGEFALLIDLQQKCAYLTSRLSDAPPASQFAMQLRKKLEGSKLEKLEQGNLDRILLLTFKTEPKLTLAAELFGDGNLILADSINRTIAAYHSGEWKDRSIKRGIAYQLPATTKLDPFALTTNILASLLSSSQKGIIPALAEKINVGATYLEEIVARSKLSPKTKASELTQQQVSDLFAAFVEIFEHLNRPRPCLYKEKDILEVSPFSLQRFDSLQPANFSSFSEALEGYYSSAAPATQQASPQEKQLAKLKFALQGQHAAIQKFLQNAKEAKEVGDKIYEKFSELDGLLNFIKEERKNKDWQGIEEEAKKQFPFLRKIDSSHGAISIAL